MEIVDLPSRASSDLIPVGDIVGLLSDSSICVGVGFVSDPTVSGAPAGSRLTDIFVITYYVSHKRGCGENDTGTDMSASHVHRLIVGISQVKTNRPQRHAVAWNIVQYVAGMLMCQNVAVATLDGDARDAGPAARWP